MHVEIGNGRLGPSYVRVHSADAHSFEMILARINVAALTKMRDDLSDGHGSIPDELLDDGHCWTQDCFDFYPHHDEEALRLKWIGMIEEMIDGFDFVLHHKSRYYGMSPQEYERLRERATAGRKLYAEHFFDLYI